MYKISADTQAPKYVHKVFTSSVELPGETTESLGALLVPPTQTSTETELTISTDRAETYFKKEDAIKIW